MGIWGHLSRRRRTQLCLLLLVMLASGAAELISLGAVFPFLAVLSDPERLWKEMLVQKVAALVGFTEASQLVLPLTLAFAAASVLVALIRLTNLWLNGRLAAAAGSDLSCEAYRRTLYQPYNIHVQRNSAAAITGTTMQVSQTVAAINYLLQMTTSSVVAVGLLIGLLLIDASVAIAAGALVALVYGALVIIARRQLQANSRKIAEASTQQLKALQEGLGAIRDVLLDGNQSYYLQIYQQADHPQRKLQAKNVFLSTFPRYTIEAIGMMAIAVFGGLLVMQRGSGAAVIPTLGALALGAQRLLPALQQIYSGWAMLKGYSAAMSSVLAMLNQPMPPQLCMANPLLFRKSILLDDVDFRYGPEQPEVLRGLRIEIRRGERIGLIGSTGSGKSTAADLLMGLLEPTSGQVLVDGENLHDPENAQTLVAWRAAIAHVPQSIYLADCSICENIAFGVPRHQIDMSRVRQAAEQAQISGFIESSYEGYNSFVGERGVRLSGGQRQRIGIARALYKQPRLLVFDEATSALDSSTEGAVMNAVERLSNDLTIVIIAHRLSTVAGCDRVLLLEDGEVVADGPPGLILNPYLGGK